MIFFSITIIVLLNICGSLGMPQSFGRTFTRIASGKNMQNAKTNFNAYLFTYLVYSPSSWLRPIQWKTKKLWYVFLEHIQI